MNNIYITVALVAINSRILPEFLMSYVGGMRASFKMSYVGGMRASFKMSYVGGMRANFKMSYVGGMRASFKTSYKFNWISDGDIISSGIQFPVHSTIIYLFVDSIGAWYIISKSLDIEFHTAPVPAGHCQPHVT